MFSLSLIFLFFLEFGDRAFIEVVFASLSIGEILISYSLDMVTFDEICNPLFIDCIVVVDITLFSFCAFEIMIKPLKFEFQYVKAVWK